MVYSRLNFVMQVQNFVGPSPKQNLRAKNAKFGVISDDSTFDGEYLQNE